MRYAKTLLAAAFVCVLPVCAAQADQNIVTVTKDSGVTAVTFNYKSGEVLSVAQTPGADGMEVNVVASPKLEEQMGKVEREVSRAVNFLSQAPRIHFKKSGN